MSAENKNYKNNKIWPGVILAVKMTQNLHRNWHLKKIPYYKSKTPSKHGNPLTGLKLIYFNNI